uniref:BRO1 domain-containing protein n=1 Tax=Ascaris lumbricoides TaxID=6252 RepID=A0A0M3I1Q7_ASCLU
MGTVEPLPKLDFTEALKDSPRQMIAIHEGYFTRLEGRLNELIRLLTTMAEHGKHYVNTFYSDALNDDKWNSKMTVLPSPWPCFAFGEPRLWVSHHPWNGESGVGSFTESLPQDATTVATLKSLSDAYAHVVYLHRVLIENASANICSSINGFIKGELAKVSETRSQLESLSTSLDDALARKAAVPRARSAELADAKNALTAVGTCFAHTALDYVAQINITQAHKDHIILDALWSFVKECNSFFSRGHAFFDEWTAIENGSISDTVAALINKGKCVERKMQDRHSLVPKVGFCCLKDDPGNRVRWI